MYGRWGARGVYFHESRWCEGYITLCTGGSSQILFSLIWRIVCVCSVSKQGRRCAWIRSRDLTDRSYFPATSNWRIICLLSKYCIGLTLFTLLCPVQDAFWMTCDIQLPSPFFHCLHNTVHKWKHLSRANLQDDHPLSDSSQRLTPARKFSKSCTIA